MEFLYSELCQPVWDSISLSLSLYIYSIYFTAQLKATYFPESSAFVTFLKANM